MKKDCPPLPCRGCCLWLVGLAGQGQVPLSWSGTCSFEQPPQLCVLGSSCVASKWKKECPPLQCRGRKRNKETPPQKRGTEWKHPLQCRGRRREQGNPSPEIMNMWFSITCHKNNPAGRHILSVLPGRNIIPSPRKWFSITCHKNKEV